MLISSWSRAARRKTVPCSSCSLSTSLAATNRGPGRTFPSSHPRQRRLSSSKPSSSPPSDNSRSIVSPENPPSSKGTSSPATARKRSISRIGRQQRSKETRAAAAAAAPTLLLPRNRITAQLPSVPSTQHLHPFDIAIASFFSLHRPISVTVAASVPPPSSLAAFSSIFDPRSATKPRPSDIILTLSSVVTSIENAAAEPPPRSTALHPQPLIPDDPTLPIPVVAPPPAPSTADAEQATPLDNPLDHPILLAIEELAKQYRPFVPPPPPLPMAATLDLFQSRAASPPRAFTAFPRLRKQAVLRAPAHHRNILLAFLDTVPPPSPSNRLDRSSDRLPPAFGFFRQRMRVRWRRWQDGRGVAAAEEEQEQQPQTGGARRTTTAVAGWWAISVKRQRKLKMKKHKYKKLMRRTRNLRRKLDRL